MGSKKLEFYDLTRPVQERFIASARSMGVPAPIAVLPASGPAILPWLALGIAAWLGAGLLTTQGFGDLNSEGAIASVTSLVLYCLCFSIGAAAFLYSLVLRHRVASLPFPTGTYLFPAGVVIARSSALQFLSLEELKEAVATRDGLRVSFQGGDTFFFKARNLEEAERAEQQLREAGDNLKRAQTAENRRDLAVLDPLRDTGFSNPFSPVAPYRRSRPLWVRAFVPLAVLLGIGCAVAIWRTRNVLSERQLFAQAKQEGTTKALSAYLSRGGKRREVREILLPRAELEDAREVGTVDAIQAYIAAHPNSKIQTEVASALREALLNALEEAKAAGTLAAIRELRKTHKNVRPIEKELAAAEHAVFIRAAERYKAEAPEHKTQEAIAFFNSLIEYAEAQGPRVQVRFRRQLRESVRRADIQVKLSAYFMGKHSIPSQYFDAPHSRAREQVTGKQLVDRLQQSFPADVLRFELGPHFDQPDLVPSDDSAPLPTPELPTLFISYNIEMTGGYMNQKPRGIFVGAGILFRAAFQIPGREEALNFKFSIWRPPDLKLLKQEGFTTEQLYEDMATSAFETFRQKYLVTLFRNP